MTHHLETRYVCDCCRAVNYVPVNNVTMAARRPEGWTVIWINDSTSPPHHLCPPCSLKLELIINGYTPSEPLQRNPEQRHTEQMFSIPPSPLPGTVSSK